MVINNMKIIKNLLSLSSCLRQVPLELQLKRLSAPIPVLRVRDELPLLLNVRGLRGRGVEIGVCRATFSSVMLDVWGGERYFAVDPWKEFPKDEYVDLANQPQHEQDSRFELAKSRLLRFGERVEIIRKTSFDAAAEFDSGSLDFVYIDGQHHYEAVKEDIEVWLPKLKPGGILCGHDYLNGLVDGCAFGVKRAVDEFVEGCGLPMSISLEKEFPSWFVFTSKATGKAIA